MDYSWINQEKWIWVGSKSIFNLLFLLVPPA
jgi:hypothetical protein